MSGDQTRRRFLKYGLATASAFVASVAVLTIDKKTGFNIGKTKFNVDMSEASATCGAAYDCSGGGGTCGAAYDCAGGGGKCGAAYNCAGQ